MMKRTKRYILTVISLIVHFSVYAYSVEVDGIYYNLIDKGRIAEVTTNPNKYSGDIIIPANFEYDGCNYDVTSIGESAFADCVGLKSVTIPNSVISIGDIAFEFCSGLTSVEIPNTVTSIGNSAFYRCAGLTSVFVPNSVTFIGTFAFAYCSSLNSISIPTGVSSIPFCAFVGCSSLKSVLIPNNVISIGSDAFAQCSGLTDVIIPGNVTSIGPGAFAGCSNLASITIPNSVGVIEMCAFQDCTSLTSITIGSGIQRIDSRAFASCKNVSQVCCYAKDVPRTDKSTFEDSFIEYSTLYVPSVSVDRYKSVAPWNEFKNITSIEEGTICNLTISAFGGGSVSYNGTNIVEGQSFFVVNEGNTAVLLTFVPNNGYCLGSVKVNGIDVTASISDNQYTISGINGDTTVEVSFVQLVQNMTVDGVNYAVTSHDEKTLSVARGDYGIVLKVPASIEYLDATWHVTGIVNEALNGCVGLAAVIWNPAVKFDAKVSNPNFLLYVTSADYAPSGIKNVIVNGTAENITLTETSGGNDFYCPKAFVARSISYSHNYSMTTGVGECRGWETIALPFNVQKIVHSEKGQLVPFATWSSGETRHPFWLYELTENGWKEAEAIKAYAPYIISMPNNELYYESSCLNGRVTFSAENVAVEATNSKTVSYNGKTFVPNFADRTSSGLVYALNVKSDWATYNGSLAEGSHFVQNLRTVHPFEAYMTTGNNARAAISIFDDDATEVQGVKMLLDQRKIKGVYNLNGQKLDGDNDRKLPAGIYIIDGQKVMVK